jgi:hypothetical protein
MLLVKQVYQKKETVSLSTHPFTQNACWPAGAGPRFRVWPALRPPSSFGVNSGGRVSTSPLDDRALADLGLSRAQQRSECAKSPWDSDPL